MNTGSEVRPEDMAHVTTDKTLEQFRAAENAHLGNMRAYVHKRRELEELEGRMVSSAAQLETARKAHHAAVDAELGDPMGEEKP